MGFNSAFKGLNCTYFHRQIAGPLYSVWWTGKDVE